MWSDGGMSFETSQPVTVGDLTFDVHAAGPEDGPPVVLLHGFPTTAASWSEVVPALVDAGLRVVAPNQRGYSPGARPTSVDQYATDLLATDVLGIAAALELGPFHLVGHDWGASVAWVVAARHPDRLASLTTFSVPHLVAYNQAMRTDEDARERASYIRLFRTEGKAEHLLLEDDARRLRAMYDGVVPDPLVETYVAAMQDPGALTAALSWYRAMTADLAELPAVTVPTTFVWSDQDRAIGRAGADACGEHVQAPFEYVVLEGVTHWIPEEAPRAAAEAIVARVAHGR